MEEAAGEYPPLFHLPDTAVIGQYVRLEIDDTTNAAGYIELAGLMICGGHQYSINMLYGAALQFETPVEWQESLGGVVFTNDDPDDESPIVRTIAVFEFDYLPDDEALIWVRDMAKRQGTSRRVLFVYDPTDTEHKHRRTFIGLMRKLPSLQAAEYGHSRAAFEIVQSL